jgi:hypothetical protein
MEFVARDQSAEPLQPSEQALHAPAFPGAALRPAVQGPAPVPAPVRNDPEAVLPYQTRIERVGITGLSPISSARSSSRKLSESVSSMSIGWCGEAKSIVTATGTLFPAAMAVILAP